MSKLSKDYRDLPKYREELNKLNSNNEWGTPNTWGNEFRKPVNKSGIYFFEGIKYCRTSLLTPQWELLYIGSSKSLSKRYNSHTDFYCKLLKIYDYVYFRFLEISDDYVELEKNLIQKLHPKYNLQHNGKL